MPSSINFVWKSNDNAMNRAQSPNGVVLSIWLWIVYRIALIFEEYAFIIKSCNCLIDLSPSLFINSEMKRIKERFLTLKGSNKLFIELFQNKEGSNHLAFVSNVYVHYIFVFWN